MAERDLHSGFYGGAVPNAAHVLLRMLDAVAPDPEGRVRPELSAGVMAPSAAGVRVVGGAAGGARRDRATWARSRCRPAPPAEFYERTGALTSVDVNMVSVGEPRTIVPAVARAHVSVRLAPGQSAAAGRRRAGAPAARGGAPGGRGLDRDRAGRPGLLRHLPSRPAAGGRGDRARLRQPGRVRAPGRHAAAARRAGRARDGHRSSAASRSPPTPSTRPTRATGWRACAWARRRRASSTAPLAELPAS